MYEQFFGLKDKPFSLTPSTRFVFASAQYRDIHDQLRYGIAAREGLMLVTGAPGTGKTTLCRDLIETLEHERVPGALLFSPFLTGTEMLAALLTEFGVNVPDDGTHHELLDRLTQFLLAKFALGTSCVAVFDEAQLLSAEALEQIRVLTNLETDEEKLIQVILVGQAGLVDLLRTPGLAQLDQRISIRCTLRELDEEGTGRYLAHRLRLAGADDEIHLHPRALREIYRGSHGVPRLINLVADRSLLAGFAARTRQIDHGHVQKALIALRGEDAGVRANTSTTGTRWLRRVLGAAAAIVLLVGGASAWLGRFPLSRETELYWRAVMAPTASDAERALRSFADRYPSSSRLPDVLTRLAQLELSRGDHAAAIEHWNRIAQLAPRGAVHSRAIALGALARFDAGDTASACRDVSPGLAASVAPDSSVARQVATLSSACALRTSLSAVAGAAADSAAGHADATPTSGADRTRSPRALGIKP